MAAVSYSGLEIALESPDWLLMSDSVEPPPKKKRTRARLDHMTPEEKQARRKEKNRQAAQTARDRKRNRLEKLEAENRRLREENMRLRGAILSSSRDQSVIDYATTLVTSVQAPIIKVNGSCVGNVDLKNNTISASSNEKAKDQNINLSKRCGGSDGRTGTPDSCNYSTSIVSPASSDESFIDSIIQNQDDDAALANEVRDLVSYVNGDDGGDVSLGSAALIHEPQQQVQDATTGTQLTENSLGWTSVQIMLILMISRIHYRSSGRINCCQRVPMKFGEPDEAHPVNCNLYDYILHTKCSDFRETADKIISNKYNVRQQRLAALHFVKRYLCHTNFADQNHKKSAAKGTNYHTKTWR